MNVCDVTNYWYAMLIAREQEKGINVCDVVVTNY